MSLDEKIISLFFFLRQVFTQDVGIRQTFYPVDLTCQYDPRRKRDAKKCKKFVQKVGKR